MSTEAEQKVDTRRRVKVYDCNDESGTWDDRGTGQVTCEYSQVSERFLLAYLLICLVSHCLLFRMCDHHDGACPSQHFVWHLFEKFTKQCPKRSLCDMSALLIVPVESWPIFEGSVRGWSWNYSGYSCLS